MKSHIYSSLRSKRPLIPSSAHAKHLFLFTEEQDCKHRHILYYYYQNNFCFQVSILTRVQCNTNSLLEARDTRVHLEEMTSSPYCHQSTPAPSNSLITFEGQIKLHTDLHQASGSRNVWEAVGLSTQTNHHLLLTSCF